MITLLLLLSAAAPAEPCLMVEGARITAGALGARFAEFRNIDPETSFGYSPSPGLTRWIRVHELRGFAGRHGLSLSSADELCVQRPSKVFLREEVLDALRAALDDHGLAPEKTRLDLLDFCRIPLPAGQLRFRLKELARPAPGRLDAATTWRGHVVFDERRSAPFWASVRLTVEYPAWVAARPIEAGRVIANDDVRQTNLTLPPHEVPPLAALEGILGMEARRGIKEGSPLASNLLVKPREVQPGERVRVEVESAGSRLIAEGKAISGGRRGEAVLIENLDSKKRFHAIVAGKGNVTVSLETSDEAFRNSDNRHIH